jgi:hypothetical protein
MFVKDNYSYTRGVGAVAAMDAVSPVRRRAAEQAARASARRDVVLAMGAMRSDGTARSIDEPIRPPRPTRPPGTPPPRPTTSPLLAAANTRLTSGGRKSAPAELIKLPGTVITPPTGGETAPTQSAVPTAAPVQPPPVRPDVTITAGGGTSWTAPPRAELTSTLPGAPEVDADLVVAPPAQATHAPPTSTKKLAVYAAIGIGVLWYLTRSK